MIDVNPENQCRAKVWIAFSVMGSRAKQWTHVTPMFQTLFVAILRANAKQRSQHNRPLIFFQNRMSTTQLMFSNHVQTCLQLFLSWAVARLAPFIVAQLGQSVRTSLSWPFSPHCNTFEWSGKRLNYKAPPTYISAWKLQSSFTYCLMPSLSFLMPEIIFETGGLP